MSWLVAFCIWLYRCWLQARFVLIGLRVAWICTASALIGFVLLVTRPEARDILLDVRDEPWLFWTIFYVVLVLAWILPVFVAARWRLTRYRESSQEAEQGM